MIFNCGLNAREALALEDEWHTVFALVPLRVGRFSCAWMQKVERRTNTFKNRFNEGHYEYRLIGRDT